MSAVCRLETEDDLSHDTLFGQEKMAAETSNYFFNYPGAGIISFCHFLIMLAKVS